MPTMPFMSRYRLSNSTPLGFGDSMLTGTVTSFPSSSLSALSCSSSTGKTRISLVTRRLTVLQRSRHTDFGVFLAEPSKQCRNTLFTGLINVRDIAKRTHHILSSKPVRRRGLQTRLERLRGRSGRESLWPESMTNTS